MKKFFIFALCFGLMFGCLEKVEKYQPPEDSAEKITGDLFKLGTLMCDPDLGYHGDKSVIQFLIMEDAQIKPVFLSADYGLAYYQIAKGSVGKHKSSTQVYWLPGIKIGEMVFLKIIGTTYIFGTEAEVTAFIPPD